VAKAVRVKTSQEKLDSLMGGFDKFESVMKQGTRQRRERDEHRLAQLKEEVTRVERAAEAETKRRVEMGRALQDWAARETKAVEDRLTMALAAQKARLEEQVAATRRRLDELEVSFAADRDRVLAEVERRNTDLAAKLEAFHEVFEAERAERRRREAAIEARIAGAEHDSEEAFAAERARREQAHAKVKERLDHAVSTRARADEKLRVWAEGELADVRTSFAAEVRQREAEDDAILAALTRYTQKLQASLHIINASDTELAAKE